MSLQRCLEVALLLALRAVADLADQPTLHQAGKACACRASSAFDPLCNLVTRIGASRCAWSACTTELTMARAAPRAAGYLQGGDTGT